VLQPWMHVARAGLGAATAPATGKLYAIGGTDVTSYFPWVEEFTPAGAAGPPTPTSTPTRTATPTPTATPAVPRTPTATPYPRPNVGVGAIPNPSARTLQAPITARDAGCAGGNNQLLSLRFTRLTNATVDVPGAGSVSAPQTMALPSHPASLTLTIHRVTDGQATTVELIVTDGCGDWPTFVGGGATVF
jgi:hypothetical protein